MIRKDITALSHTENLKRYRRCSKEVDDLLLAFNLIPGVEVDFFATSKEVGEKSPYLRIWISCHNESFQSLSLLGRLVSRNYGGWENYFPEYPNLDTHNTHGWHIHLEYRDVPHDTIPLCLTTGDWEEENVIWQAKSMAENIYQHLQNKAFMDQFGITELMREEKLNQILDVIN